MPARPAVVVTTHHKENPEQPPEEDFPNWLVKELKKCRDQDSKPFPHDLSLDLERQSILLLGLGAVQAAIALPANAKTRVTAIDQDRADYCNALFPNRYRSNLIFQQGGAEKPLPKGEQFDQSYSIRSSFYHPSAENLLCAIESASFDGGHIIVEDLFSRDIELTKSLGLSFYQSDWEDGVRRSSLKSHSRKDVSEEFLKSCRNLLSNKAVHARYIQHHLDKLELLISGLESGQMSYQRLELSRVNKTSTLTWTDKTEQDQCILVMLSGGLDSIFILWDALANTMRRVIAHHVELINREERGLVENLACQQVVGWLKKNCRDFHYTTSSANRNELSHFGMDLAAVGFEAGLAAQSYQQKTNQTVDYWQIGHCLDEGNGWPALWRNVLNCAEAGSFPFDPPAYLHRELISKAAQKDQMPHELVQFSWGCRRPVQRNGLTKACGECKTCKSRRAIGLD